MVPLRVLLAMLALAPPPTPPVHCATHTEAAPKSGTVFVSEALRRAEERVNTAYTRSRERTKAALDEGSLSPSDLLTLFKQPAPETRSAVRAAELLDNTVEIIRQMVYTQEMELKNITELLTPQDLQALAEATGCSTQTRPPHCGLSCLDSKYRSITGACNNRKFPLWGASNTPYARWLPAEYDDGFSLPRGWNSEKLHHGFTLPPVRRVSHEVLYTRNENILLDESYSHMLVEWGQWIDHDLDLTPQSASTAAFHSGADCSRSCTQRSPCFPIQIPEDDPRSCGEVECMPFFRSAPACVGGGEGQLGLVGLLSGRLGPREQLNSISSFVDASVVYGSSAPLAMALRNQSSQRGLLAINQHASDQGLAYLPYLQSGHQDPCSRPRNDSADEPASNTTSCFKAGDSRANEHLGMQALHTLFLREHNRLALELGKLNPHWSGETIYQETRKLLGAVHQVLTWRDYLPRILGPDSSPRLLPPYAGYRPLADPRIANVFATAAFRFAHVTIQPQLFRLDQNYSQSPAHPSIQLHQSFFSSWRLVHEGGVDPLIRGLVLNPAKLQTQTQMMPEELTERLFQAQGALSLDLASLNLQRGRDHGLPGYNAWRRLCGLSAPRNVSELGSVLSSPSLAEKLSALYGTPENIDVWIGAISEPLLGGARVGALLACLLGRQFRALRDGDRFWWEREGVFSAAQRSELRRVSLSRIICDNTRIQRLPRDVFNRNQYPQDFVSCDSAAIPRLHLSAWREETDDPQCGALPRVDHSFSVRCRLSVFFECHPGYHLEGPASMTCDPERGEWSQPTPICQDTGSGPPRVTYIITAVIVVIGSAALISLLVICHRRFSEKRRRPLIGGQCKGCCPGPEGGPDSTGGLH